MWCIYKVVFELKSPLHIGHGKVGNLQRTRPYVIGRAVWGALTMRMTRDRIGQDKPATRSQDYSKIGQAIHDNLAFSYFYPAIQLDNDYRLIWPWSNAEETSSGSSHRLISSYQTTALSTSKTADPERLHEVEFISPYTLDNGETVFLIGYIFEGKAKELPWQETIRRLQIGGERSYGWGNLKLHEIQEASGTYLFDRNATFVNSNSRPRIKIAKNEHILAHVPAKDLLNKPTEGQVEPLVGREWQSENRHNKHVGQHISFNEMCFTPGSLVECECEFEIAEYGIWRVVSL